MLACKPQTACVTCVTCVTKAKRVSTSDSFTFRISHENEKKLLIKQQPHAVLDCLFFKIGSEFLPTNRFLALKSRKCKEALNLFQTLIFKALNLFQTQISVELCKTFYLNMLIVI